jgi:DNA-binding transcriptional MerR regulator
MSRRRVAGQPVNRLLNFPNPENFVAGVGIMGRLAVAIPEKLFFKIGEVCELAGVQAHVLRYWESEFTMLAPQKNRAGQRVYRKRDVEIALRIKELLYEDQYTIAGAKKRLANDLRNGAKLRVVSSEDGEEASEEDASDFSPAEASSSGRVATSISTAEHRQSLRGVAKELRELLAMLEAPQKKS